MPFKDFNAGFDRKFYNLSKIGFLSYKVWNKEKAKNKAENIIT